MARVNLTEQFIRSIKRTPKNGRADYADAVVPGLGLRVTEKGHRSFVLVARYPMHPKNPTRRLLGECYLPPRQRDGVVAAETAPALLHGALTLAEARNKARLWLDLIGRGIDPAVDAARRRAAAQRVQINTFASVGHEFLNRHANGLAKFADAKRSIEGFAKRWGPRPITEIQPDEVAAAVRAIVKRGAPYQAHNSLGYLRRLYTWAIGTHEFGVTSSPVAGLRPADLIGKRLARDRVLTDGELRAVWAACGGRSDAGALAEARRRDRSQDKQALLAYPYGPVIRLLILTGQREREVADMAWSEVDFGTALWTIPATRMKGGRTHVVPLAPEALALLRALPRFTGDYVFTTTAGSKPVNGFSRTKERLDTVSGVSGWVLHDLRRSMRTHLSALPIEDRVREQMIAHAQPGLHRVYDQHAYLDEKRRGFGLWEARLAGILNPTPAGVADITEERARMWA